MKHFFVPASAAGRIACALFAVGLMCVGALLHTGVAAALFAVYFAAYGRFLWWCRRKLAAQAITAAKATNYFMWWTMGKLFATIIVLFVSIKIASAGMPFLAAFAALYVLFLAYEIAAVRELNKKTG